MNPRFHIIREGIYHTYFAEVAPAVQGAAERCLECGRILSFLRWQPPYRAEIELYSDRYGDLAFGPGNEILISERFRDLFLGERLTGLVGFDPVHITRAVRKDNRSSNAPPPRYFRVLPVRSSAVIDQEASEFVWTDPPTCHVCLEGDGLMRWKRIVIRPETWGGEDVLYARGLASRVFVSHRFFEFCQRYHLQNINLIPSEKCTHDSYPGEEYPPWAPRSTLP